MRGCVRDLSPCCRMCANPRGVGLHTALLDPWRASLAPAPRGTTRHGSYTRSAEAWTYACGAPVAPRTRRSVGPSMSEIVKRGWNQSAEGFLPRNHSGSYRVVSQQESHAAFARRASSLPTSSTTSSTSFMITSCPYFEESIPLIISIASP